MILSDRTIKEELEKGRIIIEPLEEGCIQPSSVDLHVDKYFRVFRNHTERVIDVKEDQSELTELIEIADGECFILHPGEFVLGSTRERIGIPDDLVGRIWWEMYCLYMVVNQCLLCHAPSVPTCSVP